MKKVFFSFLLSFIAIATYAQYNCTVVSSDKETVTFRAIGYGKNVLLATSEAELSAVKTICFLGAEGTMFRLPLVSSSVDLSKHKDFMDEFNKNGYKNFIEKSVIVSPFGKDSQKRKCLTLDVCVKAGSLRKYLEQHGIIRKFGL